MSELEIRDDVTIDEGELVYSTSRSGGPGGQNVNKVETRVTLRFDVAGSTSLDDETRALLLERLEARLSKDGVLSLSSQRHRSQLRNRDDVTGRFMEIVAEALQEEPERKPTRIPRRVHLRRLEEKRKRGQLKAERSADWRPDS